MEALTINMEDLEQASSENKFTLMDIVKFISILVPAVWFIVSMNAKIDRLTDAVNDLKDTGNKTNVAADLRMNNLQNQVSTNSVQIELIKKDIEILKSKK